MNDEPNISDSAGYCSHYEVDGPHWPDDCGHGGYVGTVWPILRNGKREIIDVYVFKSGIHDHDTCLRFGREGDHYTPGDLASLIKSSHFDIYEAAVKLILAKGRLTWTKHSHDH